MTSPHEYQPSRARQLGPLSLIVVGTALVVATATLTVLLIGDRIPAYMSAIAINLGMWSPVMVIAGITLMVYYRRTARIMRHGTRGTLEIVSIQPTSSRVGGRPVLRITGTLMLPTEMGTQITTRSAPSAHLAPMLRPGARLPIRADPARQTRIRIDWAAVEAATASVVSLCPPGW